MCQGVVCAVFHCVADVGVAGGVPTLQGVLHLVHHLHHLHLLAVLQEGVPTFQGVFLLLVVLHPGMLILMEGQLGLVLLLYIQYSSGIFWFYMSSVRVGIPFWSLSV